jgi:hypothetical protein
MSKLKITKTIVNGQRNLIGFMISGRERDMGGFSNNIIERGYPIESLIKMKFANQQVAVINNKFVERGNFKINTLPMCVYVAGGTPATDYIDIDNTVNLIARFVQNNENIGFRVRFSDGSEDNLKYANVIMLCKWFKPGNFSIRTSSKGNVYICGKKDSMSLDELPETVLGAEPENKPKKMKSAAKEPKATFNGAIESGFDILDIYGFIKDCNGSIIKLADEEYKAATKDGETVTEGFTSLGIGEIASPNPMFNPTKLNVSAGFKKVGIVPVTINGQVTKITSFVYRTKSIFLKGENYIKKFGIAVSTDREAELVKTLGASLALEKISDPTVIQPLSQVIDAKSLSFYKVDTSKIDLISEKKRAESIMSAKQIATLCQKRFEYKLISKAFGTRSGLVKDLKTEIGAKAVADAEGKKLFGIYSMMNEESLQAIKEAGIDLYSGAYTVAGSPVVSSAGDSEADEAVEIEYTLKGFDADKITGNQIIEFAKANDTSKLPASVIKCINSVLGINDSVAKYKEVLKLRKQADAKIEELNKKLWMHNASMYIAGNKSNIHTHDSKKWQPYTASRVKNGSEYVYIGKDVEGLTVKFKGVSI